MGLVLPQSSWQRLLDENGVLALYLVLASVLSVDAHLYLVQCSKHQKRNVHNCSDKVIEARVDINYKTTTVITTAIS